MTSPFLTLFCFFLQVIAESLSEEEIAGLKEMFKMIDTDNSGQITYEELKAGLKRVGANLKESEIYDLMHAVSISVNFGPSLLLNTSISFSQLMFAISWEKKVSEYQTLAED